VHELGFGAHFTDFTDQLLAFFVTPAGNNNLSAFSRKREGRCPADACQAPCNQDKLGIHWISPGAVKHSFRHQR
jgi:hypothetical protein